MSGDVELRREANLRRAIEQAIPEGIAVIGPDGSLQYVNHVFTAMVGWTAGELLGKKAPFPYWPEDQVATIEKSFAGAMAGNSPSPGCELTFCRKNGERFHAVVRFSRIVGFSRIDGAGDGSGWVVSALDVTESRQQIEESERQFRHLAETVPNLVWMAHADGSIFWYNRRWYEYTGTTPREMEGWGWQSVHDPRALPGVMERWKHSLATGQPFEMVFPLKGADTVFRPFLTRVEPVKDQQGSIVRWFGTNTDITEQRRIEEELRKMNRELEEFAYVASHDLQEPLRMVNIYTQLILRRLGGEDETLNQFAGYVRTGVMRMEQLIRDLLTFSRTVQRDDFPVGVADLSDSLTDALSVLRNRIEEAGAAISALPLPSVRGDARQLAHVFQNLISNSLKYRRPGHPPEISISARLEDEEWIICVQDRGIGFEQRYAERIFGLFKRLHKEEYPGTGLGLAICQRIIERYGGRIWAEGSPGDGAAFYFSLPPASDPAGCFSLPRANDAEVD